MTAPAANETPENEGCQNCQSKKNETGINEPLLQGVHGFGRLDRRNRFAHYAPLNDVRDHEQIQRNQRARPPTTHLGFANSGFAVAAHSRGLSRLRFSEGR